jgi:hypothetical protein
VRYSSCACPFRKTGSHFSGTCAAGFAISTALFSRPWCRRFPAVAELASSTATLASLHEQTCVFTRIYQALWYYDDGACPRPGCRVRARIRRARMGLPAASPSIRPTASLDRAAVLICPHCKTWIVAARGGIACLSSRYSSSQRCSPRAPAAAESSTSFPRGRTHRCGRHRNSQQARPVRMIAPRAMPSRSR